MMKTKTKRQVKILARLRRYMSPAYKKIQILDSFTYGKSKNRYEFCLHRAISGQILSWYTKRKRSVSVWSSSRKHSTALTKSKSQKAQETQKSLYLFSVRHSTCYAILSEKQRHVLVSQDPDASKDLVLNFKEVVKSLIIIFCVCHCWSKPDLCALFFECRRQQRRYRPSSARNCSRYVS